MDRSPPPDAGPSGDRGAAFRGTRLVRGSIALVLGDGISTMINLATLVVITRKMGVADFGIYSFAVAYASFAVFFTDLGVDAVTTRELAAAATEDEGRILGSALAVKSGLVVITVLVALGALLAYPSSLRLSAAIGILGLTSAVPGTLGLLLNARLRVVGRSVVSVVTALAGLVATVVILDVSTNPAGPVTVLAAAAALAAVLLAALARKARTSRLHVERAEVGRLVRGALPVGVSSVGVAVYRRADQLLLGGFGQVRDLARYAATVRLVDALNLVPLGMATVALPALAHFAATDRGEDRGDRLTAMGCRYLAAVILPIAAISTVAGGTVLALVYGEPYRSSGAVLSVLLWAHYFGFTGVMADQVLIARGQSRWLAVLTIVAAVLNVGVNLWAIPRYGALGAAWASLAAYAVPFAGGLAIAPVRDVFRSCLVASWRPAAAALGTVAVLEVVHPAGVLALPLGAGVAIVCLAATRSVTVDEGRVLVRALVGEGRAR